MGTARSGQAAGSEAQATRSSRMSADRRTDLDMQDRWQDMQGSFEAQKKQLWGNGSIFLKRTSQC